MNEDKLIYLRSKFSLVIKYKKVIMYKSIGITGTSQGINDIQKEVFKNLFLNLLKDNTSLLEFHQGQCVGADVQTASIVYECSDLTIVSHPPINTTKEGKCFVDIYLPRKGYFERNRDIAMSSDFLFVLPNTNNHRNYGGTWYTHDYAKKIGKPVCIIYPDGRVEYG